MVLDAVAVDRNFQLNSLKLAWQHRPFVPTLDDNLYSHSSFEVWPLNGFVEIPMKKLSLPYKTWNAAYSDHLISVEVALATKLLEISPLIIRPSMLSHTTMTSTTSFKALMVYPAL